MRLAGIGFRGVGNVRGLAGRLGAAAAILLV